MLACYVQRWKLQPGTHARGAPAYACPLQPQRLLHCLDAVPQQAAHASRHAPPSTAAFECRVAQDETHSIHRGRFPAAASSRGPASSPSAASTQSSINNSLRTPPSPAPASGGPRYDRSRTPPPRSDQSAASPSGAAVAASAVSQFHSAPPSPSGSRPPGSPEFMTAEEAQVKDYIRHPDFPRVPASVPLTYTLTMLACLSERPEDRPTFTHVLTVLLDVVAEVAQGTFINSDGAILVCSCCSA